MAQIQGLFMLVQVLNKAGWNEPEKTKNHVKGKRRVDQVKTDIQLL